MSYQINKMGILLPEVMNWSISVSRKQVLHPVQEGCFSWMTTGSALVKHSMNELATHQKEAFSVAFQYLGV